jgi:hypothetical protein
MFTGYDVSDGQEAVTAAASSGTLRVTALMWITYLDADAADNRVRSVGDALLGRSGTNSSWKAMTAVSLLAL